MAYPILKYISASLLATLSYNISSSAATLSNLNHIDVEKKSHSMSNDSNLICTTLPIEKKADTFKTESLVVVGDTMARKEIEKQLNKQFIPNPKRALWYAIICPGLGQFYNRKYWKLPIFYGGFLGCTYALMWNNQMYKDYLQAYLDIIDDDPATKSYLDFLPPQYDIRGKEENFKTIFKNRKDKYRRYRDMSIFAFIGVYALSIIDAYVDAQLSVFDINPNLSLSITPAVINNKEIGRTSNSFGVGCNFNF